MRALVSGILAAAGIALLALSRPFAVGAQAGARSVVTAGVLRDWPPEYLLDSNGEPTGFAVEILEAAARRAQLLVRYRIYATFSDVLAGLNKGEIDVIPSVGIAPQREPYMSFTRPVGTFVISVFVRSNSYAVGDLDALAGHRVAVVRSNIAANVLAKRKDLKLKVYPEVRAAFYDLLAGEVDALAYPEPVIHTMAVNTGLSDRIRTIGKPIAEVKRAIGVRKGDTALLERLDAAVLKLVGSQEYEQIYRRWYAEPRPFWTVARVFWTSVVIAALLLSGFAVWRARTRVALAHAERQRRSAEDALDHTISKHRTVMNAAMDGVFVVHRDGGFAEVNPRAREMLGYQGDELLSMRVSDVIAPEDLVRRPLDLKRLFEGEVLLLERELLRKDGARVPVEINASPVTDESVVAVVRDISERKRAEAALREQESMLYHAQKMEALGRLAGSVAHDFNNLLTVIQGYVGMLEDQLGAQHPAIQEVHGVRDAADRGADLCRQLLATSRRQVLAPRALRVDDLIAGLEPMLRRLIPAHTALETSLRSSANVQVDPGQLEQVIMNLVVNALDALPRGGTIRIATEDLTVDAPVTLHTGTLEGGDYVRVSVADDGSGIDAETLERIFEPFFTTKGDHGTGLGLSIVLGLVEQSGGKLDVHSARGRGTRFEIYLVASHEQARAPTPVPSADRARAERSERRAAKILVVEDEPAVLRIIVHTLQRQGYRVANAASGDEALRIAGELDDVDLLVTDVMMAGLNGIELSKRLERDRPTLKMLFLSGYTAGVLAPETLASPRRRFLQKPFTPSSLVAAVGELLQRPD